MIRINNDNLANYAMFKLDKLENEFTEEELNSIEEITINYEDETDSSFVFLEELLKFKRLKSLTLRNGFIANDNYNIFIKLSNLREIVFDNCEFEEAIYIKKLNLKSLSFYNCKIFDYSFVNNFNNLEKLTITNGNLIINKINKLTNLKYLQISYSNILDDEDISINRLEELYIDNTNINSFDFLNNLNNLKRISIDSKQYKNNKELFDNLSQKGILVLNENMDEFRGY
jgi:hypothetical protein